MAGGLQPGMTIFLEGDLGAGKTTLVRGVLRSLGFSGSVKSPTYTLVEHYVVSLNHLSHASMRIVETPVEEKPIDFYHFDLYRFDDPEEWHAAGFREYFHSRSIVMIEWPSKIQGILPLPDLIIKLAPETSNETKDSVLISGRTMFITAMTELGHACLTSC